MKKLLFLTLLLQLLSSNCKKDKTPESPANQLPPETQTGANTFGCLVDGQVFKPGGNQLNGGSYQANYQFVSNGYYLIVSGTKNATNALTSVSIYTDSLKVQQGNTYILKARTKGNISGDFFYGPSGSMYETYNTNNGSYTGELNIKKLDTINQIVSGTFWFDAVNDSGKKVEIRQGRFDMRYTR